jgi:preprotein translocase subunit SecA
MPVNSFADKWVKKIFGSSSDIFLKKVRPTVEAINALEPQIEKLSDDELKAQTQKFKDKIRDRLADFDRSPEGELEDVTASPGSNKAPRDFY